jgi:hypothetical protein
VFLDQNNKQRTPLLWMDDLIPNIGFHLQLKMVGSM